MSVTAILSGMASKASGGDFVQGAMSAMVVWLYNDFMTQEEFKRMQSVYNDSRNVKDRASAQQSIGRAMKIEPYGLKGNGGISDEEAELNAKITFAIAGGAATLSSAAVLGVKTTGEIIFHIVVNTHNINTGETVRFRGNKVNTMSQLRVEQEAREGVANLLKKVIKWIPKP